MWAAAARHAEENSQPPIQNAALLDTGAFKEILVDQQLKEHQHELWT